jgi:hypothetical protein
MSDEQENRTRVIAEARREVRTELAGMRDRVATLHREIGVLSERNLIPQETVIPDANSSAAQEAFMATTRGLQIWRQDVRVATYRGDGGEEASVDIPFSWVWENASAGLTPFHAVQSTDAMRVMDEALPLHQKCNITNPYAREHRNTVQAIEAAIKEAYEAGAEGSRTLGTAGGVVDIPTEVHLWKWPRVNQVWDVVDGEYAERDITTWVFAASLGRPGIYNRPYIGVGYRAIRDEEHNAAYAHRDPYAILVDTIVIADDHEAVNKLYRHIASNWDGSVESDSRDEMARITSRLYEKATREVTRTFDDGVKATIDSIRVVDPALADKLAERLQGGAAESTDTSNS